MLLLFILLSIWLCRPTDLWVLRPSCQKKLFCYVFIEGFGGEGYSVGS
nr:MAG TPA: hypothetical protein [Caudoviricetes sp.]